MNHTKTQNSRTQQENKKGSGVAYSQEQSCTNADTIQSTRCCGQQHHPDLCQGTHTPTKTSGVPRAAAEGRLKQSKRKQRPTTAHYTKPFARKERVFGKRSSAARHGTSSEIKCSESNGPAGKTHQPKDKIIILLSPPLTHPHARGRSFKAGFTFVRAATLHDMTNRAKNR